MRGKQAKKRTVKPDLIYKSTLVTQLTNYLMLDGKKVVAINNVTKALGKLKENTKEVTEVAALEKAIENVKPKMEVRSKRVGGANFQVPMPVSPARQVALSLRWIIDAARRARGSKQFYESLAKELTDAYKREGTAIKKREEVHRMAEANKAFSQFA